MATILLQAAGTFLGGVLGPVGAALGSAAGALAGYALDRALLDGPRRVEGPRLSGARPFTAEEGASLARVYGTVRVGGALIWATRFEEATSTQRQGGKGGPRVTEYSYHANVAFALCEGRIAGVRRVWADGRELDRETVEMRVYKGDETQAPDPLIEAKQGAGNAPAYRGTAYVVFERLPLEPYGNRIPQLQFEVMRPVGDLVEGVRAVTLIPGSTEYGLSPGLVTRKVRQGETLSLNRHVLHAGSDLAASLDELQALCPNLEHVGLVATWFGDDLRAGQCQIRPKVIDAALENVSQQWRASGLDRDDAAEVSSSGGGAAYGGSPSDESLMDAIAEIRNRGLKVTLYPFIMMDIPAGNGLPDPSGTGLQPAYPWRGRITCYPGPRVSGTADKTGAARAQVSAFCGDADPDDFEAEDDTIEFSGTAGDWGYRRFILHFAHLAAAAGGVDAFLIGSELRGLTGLRDGGDAFPFVEALCALASEVRGVVGPGTAITYGADWSEYFGHQPADGSGDVFFHLDALWAHPDIDAVGIDNYMPLSDWRDEDRFGGNPDDFNSAYDPAGLRRQIAGGEGFDWFYPNSAGRQLRLRSPITDGAYGKPWVYRNKDLVSWWSQPHHNRIGGVEKATPTAWVPRSKPFWFTELGCPAIDKGPNQPNVFADPKSSENAYPYFSSGGRSDLAQQRFLEAHLDWWNPERPGFDLTANPVSAVYGGRMVDVSRLYLWAWDARPFPAFPQRGDEWSDGGNWHLGHWLNGRLDAPSAGDLINAILRDHGLPLADVALAEGKASGYLVADSTTARSAIEPIIDLFGLAAYEEESGLGFRAEAARAGPPVAVGDMVVQDDQPSREAVRAGDAAAGTILQFRDPFNEYQTATARRLRVGAGSGGQDFVDFPGVLETGYAGVLIEDWQRRRAFRGRTYSFALAGHQPEVTPGAIVSFASGTDAVEGLVTAVERGPATAVSTRPIFRGESAPWLASALPVASVAEGSTGQPLAIFLDLPSNGASDAPEDQFRVACWRRPWRRQSVFASPEESGFQLRASVGRPATIGRLLTALGGGFEGRIDRAAALEVELLGGELSSVSRLRFLNGANAAAIRSVNGAWEVLQFQTAEEIEPDVWRLTHFLRGQLGTGDAMMAGAASGADFVLIDDAVPPAGLRSSELGLALNWRVGAAGADFSEANFVTLPQTGGLRSRLPLAPGQLRGVFTPGGDLGLSWVRRGRIGADSWVSSDIPLAEEREAYRIDIADPGGVVVRSAEASAPRWTYSAPDIAADFAASAPIDVIVRQLGSAGLGLPATRRFTTL